MDAGSTNHVYANLAVALGNDFLSSSRGAGTSLTDRIPSTRVIGTAAASGTGTSSGRLRVGVGIDIGAGSGPVPVLDLSDNIGNESGSGSSSILQQVVQVAAWNSTGTELCCCVVLLTVVVLLCCCAIVLFTVVVLLCCCDVVLLCCYHCADKYVSYLFNYSAGIGTCASTSAVTRGCGSISNARTPSRSRRDNCSRRAYYRQ